MKRFQNNWPSIRYVWAESHMYVVIQVYFFFSFLDNSIIFFADWRRKFINRVRDSYIVSYVLYDTHRYIMYSYRDMSDTLERKTNLHKID